MKYTTDYFIKKFTSISKNKWYIGEYSNDEETKFCVLGHCGETNDDNTKESLALGDIFRVPASNINDGLGDYKKLGKHPRTRILNALKLVKKGFLIS